jgi:hypothetical protein
MALVFLQMVLSLLFAMSLFHKIYKRSVSTFVVFFIGFLWVVSDSFEKGEYGLWVVSVGLIFIYWRAMQKPPSDSIV